MSRAARTGRMRTQQADRFSRSLLAGSRVLMCLIALLLAVAPWTEYFGTFDNFPHGQDLELSLLAFLALVCLVLLLALRWKQGLKDIFSVSSERWPVIWKLGRIPERGSARIADACHSPPLRSGRSAAYNLPLQI